MQLDELRRLVLTSAVDDWSETPFRTVDDDGKLTGYTAVYKPNLSISAHWYMDHDESPLEGAWLVALGTKSAPAWTVYLLYNGMVVDGYDGAWIEDEGLIVPAPIEVGATDCEFSAGELSLFALLNAIAFGNSAEHIAATLDSIVRRVTERAAAPPE